MEAEFLMSADFVRMKADFNKLLINASSAPVTKESGKIKVDLETCIMNFARPETLDKDNKLFCEQCKTKTEAVKYTFLSRDPEFLIVNLRRFKVVAQQR